MSRVTSGIGWINAVTTNVTTTYNVTGDEWRVFTKLFFWTQNCKLHIAIYNINASTKIFIYSYINVNSTTCVACWALRKISSERRRGRRPKGKPKQVEIKKKHGKKDFVPLMLLLCNSYSPKELRWYHGFLSLISSLIRRDVSSTKKIVRHIRCDAR